MSQFVDPEAEESEGEGEDMGKEEHTKIISKKKNKVVRSDDEDEGEDEDDEQVVNDLIDDNPIEEDDSDDDESNGSRKRKKSDDEDDLSDRLEDEDYDLIEENLGVKVQRKKFKRLKRIEDDDSDLDETQGVGGDREAIANQLFEESDNEDERREPVREEMPGRQYASEESEGEHSETDDFIVDDEGRPMKEVRRRRRPVFTDASLQEAQDIFGVDFDFEQLGKYGEEGYDYEDDEEDEEDVFEGQRPAHRKKKLPRGKAKSIYEIYEPHELERAGFTDEDHKIRSKDVPERMQLRSVPLTSANDEELDEEAEWIYKTAFFNREAKKQFTNQVPDSIIAAESEANWGDDWDRQTTFPGPARTTVGVNAPNNETREDEVCETPSDPAAAAPIRKPPATQVGNEDEENWEEEEWGAPSIITKDKSATEAEASAPVAEKPPEEVKPQILPKIRKALDFMRNQSLEVPFIAFYRKEYVQPDLSINDLWKIYKLDARFCQLKSRKCRLVELCKNMRDYQTDLIMAKPDDPILDSMRLITEDDIERIQAIKNSDELKDMFSFFTLYYAEEVPLMKAGLRRKDREERQRARDAAAAAERGDGEGDEDPPIPEIEPEDMDQGGLGAKSGVRRKIGGGAYGMCKKLGVDSFIKKFGLPPAKFAENLRDNYQRYEVDQYPTDPLEAATEMCSERIKTPEEVLKAAKFMMATQISREPIVRQCVREVFFERATISCYPSKEGQKEMDEAHPCFAMKYLKDKPVRDLTKDQFLKLIIAEDDRLLIITLGDKLKGITTDNYIDEVKLLFQKDEFSKNVQDWNTLRGDCIEFAFEKLLYPVLRKELRSKLIEDAKEHVIKSCCAKLYNWIKVAPYVVSFPDTDEEDWDTSRGFRVLAIAYGHDYEQASFACLIGADGEPSDYLRLPNIIKSKNSYRETDRKEKEADVLTVKNFVRSKKPHLIVIGGESREAQMLQADISDSIGELISQDGFPKITVEVVDNQLAKVYANSLKATHEFRDYPLLLRQAVSLGRRIQDPLIEFSQLCTADEEILCMRFHALQDHVPKDELLDRLQLEFVNRANEVGIDVNKAITSPYTANLVQFTCGLGPRKATALLKILKQNNQRLENRTQLITACHVGSKIFRNCSGFIKIDTKSLGDSTESYIEVLDGSRVHPETYEWARKMAVDALDEDEDANPASALEEILESPEKLKDLDLDAFAVELEKQGYGNKSITLYDIRAELNHRYKDVRTGYECPNAEEVFNMLTKETPETLCIGKLVTASVIGISHKKPPIDQLDNAVPIKSEVTGMWQCSFCGKNDYSDLSEVWAHFDAGACPGQATGVRIRLDNGIFGFIPIAKLSDSHVTNPEQRVKRGQTIHCRVMKINVERFSVECTSRTSDLLDTKGEWRPQKDPNYDQEKEDFDNKKEEEVRKYKHQQTYLKRDIVHPSFKNISFREVEKRMETMDQGEVIVRPSSKGASHLTVTWKVSDGVYQHIDIREERKDNVFSLGQSLWIGTDEFEDLDEIIACHVNPMASHARDLIGYKYYKGNFGGCRKKADEYLLEEKAKNRSKIHYILQASKEYPGKFLISYLPKTKSAHEFITVTPEGFRFRKHNFDDLNQLLKWFKEHYRDPPPAAMIGTPQYQASHPFTVPGHIGGVLRADPAPARRYNLNPARTPHTTPHYTTPEGLTPYGRASANAENNLP